MGGECGDRGSAGVKANGNSTGRPDRRGGFPDFSASLSAGEEGGAGPRRKRLRAGAPILAPVLMYSCRFLPRSPAWFLAVSVSRILYLRGGCSPNAGVVGSSRVGGHQPKWDDELRLDFPVVGSNRSEVVPPPRTAAKAAPYPRGRESPVEPDRGRPGARHRDAERRRGTKVVTAESGRWVITHLCVVFPVSRARARRDRGSCAIVRRVSAAISRRWMTNAGSTSCVAGAAERSDRRGWRCSGPAPPYA